MTTATQNASRVQPTAFPSALTAQQAGQSCLQEQFLQTRPAALQLSLLVKLAAKPGQILDLQLLAGYLL
jgi:hypothetical protein